MEGLAVNGGAIRTWIALATLLAAGCGCPQPPPRPVPPPVTAAHGRDFLARQRVTGTFQGKRMTLEAAVQKRGDRLVVIGLTPFGVKAFTLEQTGARWTMTEHLKQKGGLPLDPAFLLADLHRAFLGMGGPDEVCAEERRDGRVVARRFHARSGCPEGEVVVTYEGGLGPDGAPPRRTVLDNGYHHYRLEIETLTHRWLDK